VPSHIPLRAMAQCCACHDSGGRQGDSDIDRLVQSGGRIHLCAMTHSAVCRDSFCACHDSGGRQGDGDIDRLVQSGGLESEVLAHTQL